MKKQKHLGPSCSIHTRNLQVIDVAAARIVVQCGKFTLKMNTPATLLLVSINAKHACQNILTWPHVSNLVHKKQILFHVTCSLAESAW